MNKPVITLTNVGIKFRKYKTKLRHHRAIALTELFRLRGQVEEFWALKDISFTVAEGDAFGVIGNNGSGKTTLCRLIAGVLYPDKGNLTILGDTCSLLTSGAGFMQDLPGIDNIFMSGMFLGMREQEVRNKLDEIIAFSEIGDFITTPVKYYSSGMKARLGLSIALHMDPDILVLDEAMSAGDKDFREKAAERMKVLMGKARAIVISTHNMSLVTDFCSMALCLDRGSIKYFGKADEVVEQYVSM